LPPAHLYGLTERPLWWKIQAKARRSCAAGGIECHFIQQGHGVATAGAAARFWLPPHREENWKKILIELMNSISDNAARL
jgi:hypothetical protein